MSRPRRRSRDATSRDFHRIWALNLCTPEQRKRVQKWQTQRVATERYREKNREAVRQTRREWGKRKAAEGYFRKGGAGHQRQPGRYARRREYFQTYFRARRAAAGLSTVPRETNNLGEAR